MERPLTLPKWVMGKGLTYYFITLAVISGLFMSYMMEWYWIAVGLVEIVMFWYVGRRLSEKWMRLSEKKFEKNLMLYSFLIRLAYMLIMYWVFMQSYGHSFGFDYSDTQFYDDVAKALSSCYRNGQFNISQNFDRYAPGTDLSDQGYAVYLSFIYYLSNDSIIVARIIKCFLSALTTLYIYRLAKRNFGEEVARMAGVMYMLYSNSWYYCGVHLKETEMVFLSVLFVDQADDMFKNRNFTAWKVVPVVLIAAAMFTFRTPLALVAIFSLLFMVFMSSSRVVNWGKRILVGGLAVLLVGVGFGDSIQQQSQELYNRVAGGEQQKNMQWRATGRANSNLYAKYAGAAVFAPLIFTLPFPTMTETPNQEIQRIHHVGNYTKNVLSGLVIFAMFSLLFSGRWREHMMPLAFMLGYLVVLVMSTFAQAERFHQPAQPFEVMFAAYGIWLVEKGQHVFGKYLPSGRPATYKRWFGYWMIFVFVACVGWNYIKLKGRGL